MLKLGALQLSLVPNNLIAGLGGGGFSWQASSGALPSGSTFARASSATYYNSSSLLSTATTDTPRFSYDPSTGAGPYLLIEPTATNLYVNSQPPTNWSASNITTSTSSYLGPDGTTYFENFNDGTSTGVHEAKGPLVNQNDNPITLSLFARKGSETILQLAPYAGYSPSGYANFDLSAGTSTNYSAVSAIQNIGNSIYRISISATETITGSHSTYWVIMTNGNSGAYPSYTGVNGDVNVWGAQYEVGNVATSYIPTSGSTATRAADAWTTPTIPAGINYLTFTFDDNSTQKVAVTSGSTYSVPTNLNRPLIKSYVGSAS